jgi:hypothetical protein
MFLHFAANFSHHQMGEHALQGRPCRLVAPSQPAQQTHTRARPTAGSRFKAVRRSVTKLAQLPFLTTDAGAIVPK